MTSFLIRLPYVCLRRFVRRWRGGGGGGGARRGGRVIIIMLSANILTEQIFLVLFLDHGLLMSHISNRIC